MRKKRKWVGFLLTLGMLGGLGLFSSPFIIRWINNHFAYRVIENYQQEVGKLTVDERKQWMEKARKYNESLTNGERVDPFSDESAVDIQDEGGILGYIEIPKISVYLPIYEGTSTSVLQKGVGHMRNTSYPIGGKGSHAALSAHRGLPSAKLFTDLDKLEKGDFFYLYVLDETLAYEVDQIKVIEPEIKDELDIDSNEDYVTLITCTPYGINSHRLLVRGSRVPYSLRSADELNEVIQIELAPIWYFVALLLICFLAWAVKKIWKHRKGTGHGETE